MRNLVTMTPHARLALLAVLGIDTFARAQAPSPAFAAGDLSQLVCRVTDVKTSGELRLLSVEVKNTGQVHGEPLEFRIEAGDKKGRAQETFRRVQLPCANRFGRPATAGGKQSYVVASNLPGKRGSYSVTVTAASWYTDGVVPAPALAIGKPQQVQRTSLAGQFPVTQVELQNPFDRDLDVLLLVTLVQPIDTVELMGLRLAAGQKRNWIIASRAGVTSYLDETAVAGPVKATAFEVVDWSLVGAADPVAVEQLLRPAYERWYRWPDGDAEVSGRFAFRERRQKLNAPTEYETFVVSGRFTLPRGGDPVVQQESGAAANASMSIAQAFEPLRRPDFAGLLRKNELLQLTTDRVQLRGPGWTHERTGGAAALSTTGTNGSADFHADVQVLGDRIVSVGHGDGPRTRWEVQELGAGYVVTRTRSGSTVTTCSYGECAGRTVPLAFASTTTFGTSLFSTSQLTLSELTFADGQRVTAAPPGGDGAGALRAIWDAGYHLPEAPLQITASFEAKNPGTDQLWLGYKRLEGKLEMTGIGSHVQRLHVDFTTRLSPEVENDLAFMIRDRLLMWYGRDFNDRPPFDEFFAGAKIAAMATDGSFRVEAASVDRVMTKDGLVRGWHSVGGGNTRFEWRAFGDLEAVVKVELDKELREGGHRDAWTETVTIGLAPVGDHLLPDSLKLEHIFGRLFGTETIVFDQVSVN